MFGFADNILGFNGVIVVCRWRLWAGLRRNFLAYYCDERLKKRAIWELAYKILR